MAGADLQRATFLNKPHLSFEFFPTRTPEGFEKLKNLSQELLQFNPDCFTVTFGAGGSTREKTFETVKTIQNLTHKPTAAHLSCIDSTQDNILKICRDYQNNGINHLVCLRGDIPSGMGSSQDIGEFKHASDLIRFIRENFGAYFNIAVAAYPEYHPQSSSPDQDFLNFKFKVEQGADLAYTQYFYNPDAYFYFLEKCHKNQINIPIVPGIMPIINFTQIARFSESCGAEIPKWIRKNLEKLAEKDPENLEDLKKFGLEILIKLCENLLKNGAPGLHIYTMNHYAPTAQIMAACF